MTALHIAAYHGHADIVEMITERLEKEELNVYNDVSCGILQ